MSKHKYTWVKVEVMCPFCGHYQVGKTALGSGFTQCRACRGKIFNRYATEVKGVPDKKGFYYYANEPMIFGKQKNEYRTMFGVEEINAE